MVVNRIQNINENILSLKIKLKDLDNELKLNFPNYKTLIVEGSVASDLYLKDKSDYDLVVIFSDIADSDYLLLQEILGKNALNRFKDIVYKQMHLIKKMEALEKSKDLVEKEICEL